MEEEDAKEDEKEDEKEYMEGRVRAWGRCDEGGRGRERKMK
jgi:hypothetical protein